MFSIAALSNNLKYGFPQQPDLVPEELSLVIAREIVMITAAIGKNQGTSGENQLSPLKPKKNTKT